MAADEVLELGGGSYARHDSSHLDKVLAGATARDKAYVSTFSGDPNSPYLNRTRQAAAEGRAELFIGSTYASRGRDEYGQERNHVITSRELQRMPGVHAYRQELRRVEGGPGTRPFSGDLGEYGHTKIVSRAGSDVAYLGTGSFTATDSVKNHNVVRELRGQAAREAHQVNLVLMGRAAPSTVAKNQYVRMVGPQGDTKAVYNSLLGAIDNAKREIVVGSANLSDPRIIRALEAAGRRGVNVIVGDTSGDTSNTNKDDQAIQRLRGAKGISIHRYADGHRHWNFLGVDDGEFTAFGSTRLNSAFMSGKVTDVMLLGKDKAGYSFFRSEVLRGEAQAQVKSSLKLSYNVGHEFRGLGLERFMPQVHSQGVAYAARIDPASLVDSSNMYLAAIKRYHLGAVQGDAAAKILEDRWKSLYTKFRNEPGAFSALYTMLTHEHKGVRPDITEVPWLLRNADAAMKTATLGQDSLLFNAIGGQVGQRGFLGSGLINFGRKLDHVAGTHDGSGAAGGFETVTTGGVDLMTSLVSNAVMFQFAALPVMRFAAAVRGNFDESFRKASAATGYSDGLSYGTGFSKAVQAGDAAVSSVGLRAYDVFARPLLEALGPHGRQLSDEVRGVLGANRKNLPEAMVQAYMKVDKAYEGNTFLRPLSTQGVGLLYDRVLNLGHLVDYAKNIGTNIQTALGLNHYKEASKAARAELAIARDDLQAHGLSAFSHRAAPLSKAFERTATPHAFDVNAFQAAEAADATLGKLGRRGEVVVQQLRRIEDEVYRLRVELNDLNANDPTSARMGEVQEKLARWEKGLNAAHAHAQQVLDRHPVFADVRDAERHAVLQENIQEQKLRLKARGQSMEDDASVRDHIVSMERERDSLKRFNFRNNFNARVGAVSNLDSVGGRIHDYKEVGFVANIKRALDVNGDLVRGVRGRASSAAYLLLGAGVGVDLVSADVASAPRITLWEQIGAAWTMASANKELTDGARQDLQLDYRAGFGRLGNTFFEATGGIIGLSHAAAAVGHAISLVSYAVQKVVSPLVRLGQFAMHVRDTVRSETANSGQMAELMGAYLTGNVYTVSKRLKENGKLSTADKALLRTISEKDPEAINKLAGDLYNRVLQDSQANAAPMSATSLSMYGAQFVMGSANLMSVTMGASTFNDTTYFGVSIQAPVVLQAGINVQLPIGLHHFVNPETGEPDSEVTYVPGSNAELAAWTALQFKAYGAGAEMAKGVLSKSVRAIAKRFDPAGEHSHWVMMSEDLGNAAAVKAVRGTYNIIDKTTSFIATMPLRGAEALAGGATRAIRGFTSRGILSSIYVTQLDPTPEGVNKIVSRLVDERQDESLSIFAADSKSPLNQVVAEHITAGYEGIGKAMEDKGLGLAIKKGTLAGGVASFVLNRMGFKGQEQTVLDDAGNSVKVTVFKSAELARAIAQPFRSLDVFPSFAAHAELNRQLALHGGDLSKLDRHLQDYAKSKTVRALKWVTTNVPRGAAAAMALVAGSAVVVGSARFENAAEAVSEFAQSNWLTRLTVAPLFYFFGIGGNKSRTAPNSQEVVEHGKLFWGASSLQNKDTVNDARQVVFGSFIGKLTALYKSSPVYAGVTSGYAGSGSFGFAIDPVKGSVVDPRTGNEFVLSGPFAQMTGLLSVTGNLMQLTGSSGARSARYSDRSAAEFGLGLAMAADMGMMLRAHKFAPRTQRATVGAMWHEASANNTLGMAGKLELRRREFLTSWVLANNNSADIFNYFFRSRSSDRNLFAEAMAHSTGRFAFGHDGTSFLAAKRIYQAMEYARSGAAGSGMPEVYMDYSPEMTDREINRRRGLSIEELTSGDSKDSTTGISWLTSGGALALLVPIVGAASVAFAGVGLAVRLNKDRASSAEDRLIDRESHRAAALEVQGVGEGPNRALFVESALEAGFDPAEAEAFADKKVREAAGAPKAKRWSLAGGLLNTIGKMASASTSTVFKAVLTRKDGESFEDSVRREAVHDVARKVFGSDASSGFSWAAVEPTGLGANVESALDYDGAVNQHPGHTLWVVRRGRDVYTFGGVDFHTRDSVLADAKTAGVKAPGRLMPSHSSDRRLVMALDSLAFDSRSSVVDAPIGSIADEMLGSADGDGNILRSGTDAAGNIRIDDINWSAMSNSGAADTVIGRLLYRAGDTKTIREALGAAASHSTEALDDINKLKAQLERQRSELTGRLSQADGKDRARLQKRLDTVSSRMDKLEGLQEAWRGRGAYARALLGPEGLFGASGPMAALQRASLSLASVIDSAEKTARKNLGAAASASTIRAEVVRLTSEDGRVAAIQDQVNQELLKLRQSVVVASSEAGGVVANLFDDVVHQVEGESANVIDLAQDLIKKQQMVAKALISGSGSFGDQSKVGLMEALGYARPKDLEQFVYELGGGFGNLHAKNVMTRVVDAVTLGGVTAVGQEVKAWRDAQTEKLAKHLAADVLKTSENLGQGHSEALGVSARNVLTAIARGEVKTTDADFEDFVKTHLVAELGDEALSTEMTHTLASLMQGEAKQRVMGYTGAMNSFAWKAGLAAKTSVKHAGRLSLMGAFTATGILAPIKDNSSYFILGMMARGISNNAIDEGLANQMAKDTYQSTVDSLGANLVSASGALLTGVSNKITEGYVNVINKLAVKGQVGFTLGFETLASNSDVIAGDSVSGSPTQAKATRLGWTTIENPAVSNVGKALTYTTKALAGVGGALQATAVTALIGTGVGAFSGTVAGLMGADSSTAVFLGTQAGVASAAVIGAAQGIVAATATIKKVADAARVAGTTYRTLVATEGLMAAGAASLATGGAALAPLIPMALALGVAMGAGLAADWAYTKYVEPKLVGSQEDVARGLQNFVSQDNWKGSVVRTILQAPSFVYTQAQRLYDGTWGQVARWGTNDNDSGFAKMAGTAARFVQATGIFSFLGDKAMDYHDPERTYGSSVSLDQSVWQMPFVRGEGSGKGSAFFASRMTPFFYGNRHDLLDMMYRQQQSMLVDNPEAIARQWVAEDHSGSIPDPADSHITNAPNRMGGFFRRSFAGQSTLGEAAQEMLALRGQLTGFAVASLDSRLWGDKDHEAQIPLDKKHAWHNQTFGISTAVMRRSTWVAETFQEIGRAFRRWTGSAAPGARRQEGGSGPTAWANGAIVLNFSDIVAGGVVTSRFGPRVAPTAGASTYHKGVDFGAAAGTPFRAAGAGTVTISSYQGGAGNMVAIDHGNGVSSVYMHMQHGSLQYRVGAHVERGQMLGRVGNTGFSTGPHAHFGLMINGVYVDPMRFTSGAVRSGRGGQGGADLTPAQEATVRGLVAGLKPEQHHDHDHDHDAAQRANSNTIRGANVFNFSTRVNNALNAAANRYGLDPLVLKVLAMRESGGDPRARSWAGAVGVIQLMPDTAKAMGVADSTNPEQNTMGGARYLAGILKNEARGDLFRAFAGYNAGPGTIRFHGRLVSNIDLALGQEGIQKDGIEQTLIYANILDLAYRAAKRAEAKGTTITRQGFNSIVTYVHQAVARMRRNHVAGTVLANGGRVPPPPNLDLMAVSAAAPLAANVDPSKPAVGKMTIQTQWDRERQKLLVQASYPDGTPYLNMVDPYMEPIEMQLVDPYAGGLQ